MPEPGEPRPYEIAVPQADLDDLRARLARTRWPDALADVGWDYGVDPACLRELAEHWQDGYNWRQHERRLNRLPQYLIDIDGQQVHYAHLPTSQPDAIPLLLIHCWPSTFADFAPIAAALAEPTANGAHGQPAFDVVIPSLPGFAFSGPTTDQGWDVSRMARTLAALMRKLGYERYLIQGGGWASLIGPAIAAVAPEAVIGIHMNAMINGSNVNWNRPDPTAGMTDAEIAELTQNNEDWMGRSGYAAVQSTRPQTLAYALNDSPVGLLAWILDLEWGVSDQTAPGETRAPADEILTIASLFWFTQTAGSSMRFYKDHGSWLNDVDYNPTPTAVAVFPGDKTLRSVAERHHNVVRYTEFQRGGWFASIQAPDLLVGDLRRFAQELQN